MRIIPNYNSKQNFQGSVNWKTLGSLGEDVLSFKIEPELDSIVSEIDKEAAKLPADYEYNFKKFIFGESDNLIGTLSRLSKGKSRNKPSKARIIIDRIKQPLSYRQKTDKQAFLTFLCDSIKKDYDTYRYFTCRD